MKFKIILDSSSNMKKDDIKSDNVSLDIAPLTVHVAGKDYVDDGTSTRREVLDALNATKEKSTSSCPAPYAYLSKMTDADYYIIITLSSKLSGSYNSALVAKNSFSDPDKVLVIDSKLVAGSMELIAREAFKLINENKSFEEISKELVSFTDNMQLLFVLNKFDNFVKSGRVNRIVGFLASKLLIKPLCIGEDGEIKIKEKVRTIEGVLKRLVINIGKLIPETKGRNCIISETDNQKGAEWLKNEIEKQYHFDSVTIRENNVLCSFYALEGGIIVCF